MARIRTIKPDFWNDEKLGQENESVMLTFIGLWNFSDDYGVVKANPLWLKNQIFPYKDKLRIDAFSIWLVRLVELEVIIPFTYRGESFYYIRNFRRHQKIDRPSKARNVPEAQLILILQTHSPSPHNTLAEPSPKEEYVGREEEEEGTARNFVLQKPNTPTLQQVEEFFWQQGIQNLEEAQRFFNNCEAKAWMAGITPILNWRSLARNWITNPIGQAAKKPIGRKVIMEYFMGGTVEWTEDQYLQYCNNPAASGYTFVRYED